MSTAPVLALALALGLAALLSGPGLRAAARPGTDPAAAGPGARPAAGLAGPLRTRWGRDVTGESAEWVALLRRLAALLEAGRSPAAAFRAAGPSGGPASPTAGHIDMLCTSVAASVRLGLSASAALASAPAPELGHRGLQRRATATTADLALCWAVSERTGAPLTGLLGGLADALEADLDADAARSTALAGPRSTVRILTWLPALGIGLGMLMGVHPLRTLLTTPWGLAALGAGAVLTAAGRAWTRSLIGRAEAAGAR